MKASYHEVGHNAGIPLYLGLLFTELRDVARIILSRLTREVPFSNLGRRLVVLIKVPSRVSVPQDRYLLK